MPCFSIASQIIPFFAWFYRDRRTRLTSSSNNAKLAKINSKGLKQDLSTFFIVAVAFNVDD